MSVNGVTGAGSTYSTYSATPKSTDAKTESKGNTTAQSNGVVYEPSKEDATASTKNISLTPR